MPKLWKLKKTQFAQRKEKRGAGFKKPEGKFVLKKENKEKIEKNTPMSSKRQNKCG